MATEEQVERAQQKEPRREHPFGFFVIKQLQDAGIIGKGIQRLVLDIRHDDYPRMYVQQIVNQKTLDIVFAEPGLTVVATEVKDEQAR